MTDEGAKPARDTILVVDDEPRIRRVLEVALDDLGFRVIPAGTAAEAAQRIDEERIDVVLTDLQLPDRSGLELLADVRAARTDLPVILITAFGTVETAVRAIKLGAFDYVTKPFRVEELETVLRRALELRWVERENAYLRDAAAPAFEGITAVSAAMKNVTARIERVAPTSATVLVTGETGTGKELVARAIHANSPRADRLFVAINCAAIPAELLEAELFGVTRGAYTGATADRPGRFELADGGTLFLDEIGDLPLAMQPKLLRAIQEGTVERLGSNTVRRIDVRIIAATHRDLEARVARGDFRADLYYRLAVVPIHVPPLRERPEDIPAIAHETTAHFARRLGRDVQLSAAAVRQLEAYAWPGNVRELGNIIERAVILADGPVIDHFDLPGTAPSGPGGSRFPDPAGGPSVPPGGADPLALVPLRAAVEHAERDAILAALRHTGDNKTAAAELLGISVRTLWYKIERLGLQDG